MVKLKSVLYLNINPSLQSILWNFLYLVMEICNSLLQIPPSRPSLMMKDVLTATSTS